MNKALIIIDVQNFYFGENGLEGNIQASQNAQKLLIYFRKMDLPVFHVQHLIAKSDPAEDYESKVRIHENVKPMAGEALISKRTPGSFKGTELLDKLKEKNIDELVICGMMSHMCVDTTTREAFDLDFKCTVIHDACATRTLKFNNQEIPAAYVHATAMAALQFAFAKVISCEEFLKGN
ncbi:MAG TPA: cysteine hydrolase family protein [Bacillota bacterium]|nr:cysteine hydrolase family protein [Bacillota bacterium]